MGGAKKIMKSSELKTQTFESSLCFSKSSSEAHFRVEDDSAESVELTGDAFVTKLHSAFLQHRKTLLVAKLKKGLSCKLSKCFAVPRTLNRE